MKEKFIKALENNDLEEIIKRIHQKYAPAVIFVPEIAFVSPTPIDELNHRLDRFLDQDYFKSIDMFGDEFVVPRNTSAIKFYRDCGFDHLNMIQLRKNYDERLNKTDEVEVLGFKLKKY